MWHTHLRRQRSHAVVRFASDLTDEEWAAVAAILPPPRPGGRPRSVPLREVLNGLLYLLSTGCRWRALPEVFPPRSTIAEYASQWRHDGTLLRLYALLQTGVPGQIADHVQAGLPSTRAGRAGGQVPTHANRE